MSFLNNLLHSPRLLRKKGAEMNDVVCPVCRKEGRISFAKPGTKMRLRGVITCENHEPEGFIRWPITIVTSEHVGILTETAPSLPAHESPKLLPIVPEGLRQDIQEAELGHFNQCLKAAVVMCRRALQLALEEKMGLQDNHMTLGPLLAAERKQGKRLFTDGEYSLAVRIKELGDGGAHKVLEGSPSTVAVAIHDAVQLLNALYKPPAVQSGTSSNAP